MGAVALVVASAQVLIPAVTGVATRLQVPESIIAATMVAFGTSLPELVTAVTAARRGHGELAVGNVVGADILNVLFVAGAAAAVTPGGLAAGQQFFVVLFPDDAVYPHRLSSWHLCLGRVDETALRIHSSGSVWVLHSRQLFDARAGITLAEKFRIELLNIGHTFLPGHRVWIEICSRCFPHIAPNTNTSNAAATDTDWKLAHQTIYHDSQRPSHVHLPVMPGQ